MRSLIMAGALVCVVPMMTAAAGVPNAAAADTKAVEAVLARYMAAVETLDPSGTQTLFTSDSEIFESGGSEGTYAHYLEHHLLPEFAEFKSFHFSDYKVSVRFEGNVALATETYRYRIEPKSGAVAERQGVATSVLRKSGGRWQIVVMHNSSRRPTPG